MVNNDSVFVEMEDTNVLYGWFSFSNVVSVGEMLKELTDEQKMKLIKRIKLVLREKVELKEIEGND